MLLAQDLHKTFPNGVHALRGVHFNSKQGEFVAIIGLSGSGKSTLLKCLNRTIEPSSGQILFEGKDLLRLEGDPLRRIRAKMSMVFQQFHLIHRYTVLTNVLTGALGRWRGWRPLFGLWGEDLEREALEKLSIVGLQEKSNSRVDELSGGQQQRVAVARALMQNPLIILADEPVASLDPTTSLVIMDHLRDINRRFNLTTICTLHSMDLATRYADKIVAVREGQIIFEGRPHMLDNAVRAKIYAPH